jgi:type II secretory pathway pseudopilin PulG
MKRRCGFTILELTVSAIMLGAILAVAMKFFTTIGAQHRTVRRQQLAIRELANVMEGIAALPWDRLTPEGLRQTQLSEVARQGLPSAELAVEITQPDGEPQAKRIAVQIRWQDRPDLPPRPLRAASWRYNVEQPKRRPEGGTVR